MTTKTLFTLGALFLSFNALGCAMNTGDQEAAERTGEAEEAILNGTTDPSYAYRAVSMVIDINPDSIYTPTACSGTLIASAWVLTAAHCVSHSDGTPLDPSRFFVEGGGAVSQVYVMPNWHGWPNSPASNGYDVALLHLSGQALYQTTAGNLACTGVNATYGCLLTPLYFSDPTGLPADSKTIHCVSNGPRTAGGSFHGFGDADAADFVENDSYNYWVWYAYTPNAAGQRLFQTDEGGGCFSKLSGSDIRGSLLSVNSFESTYYGTPVEYATTSPYFRSWVESTIPSSQRAIVIPPGRGNEY